MYHVPSLPDAAAEQETRERSAADAMPSQHALTLQVPAQPPRLLPMLWQGMLSFASSAALDEMFGAYASARRGYAQAAALAWDLDDLATPGISGSSSERSASADAAAPRSADDACAASAHEPSPAQAQAPSMRSLESAVPQAHEAPAAMQEPALVTRGHGTAELGQSSALQEGTFQMDLSGVEEPSEKESGSTEFGSALPCEAVGAIGGAAEALASRQASPDEPDAAALDTSVHAGGADGAGFESQADATDIAASDVAAAGLGASDVSESAHAPTPAADVSSAADAPAASGQVAAAFKHVEGFDLSPVPCASEERAPASPSDQGAGTVQRSSSPASGQRAQCVAGGAEHADAVAVPPKGKHPASGADLQPADHAGTSELHAAQPTAVAGAPEADAPARPSAQRGARPAGVAAASDAPSGGSLPKPVPPLAPQIQAPQIVRCPSRELQRAAEHAECDHGQRAAPPRGGMAQALADVGTGTGGALGLQRADRGGGGDERRHSDASSVVARSPLSPYQRALLATHADTICRRHAACSAR